jgi:TolB protein
MTYNSKAAGVFVRAALAAGCVVSMCAGALLTGCGSSVRPVAFEGSGDIGEIQLPGLAQFYQRQGEYRITGSGDNIWGRQDAFYYVWKEVEGDLTLTADVRWAGAEKLNHRKAGWMVRQNLEADAAYADVMSHGDGLICLQFRKAAGGDTADICRPVKEPATIKLERNGDVFNLSVAHKGGAFEPVGSMTVKLTDPVYAGLAVSSHDGSITETAVFSNVTLENPGVVAMEDRMVESSLEIVSIETGRRKVVYRADEHFEAPNWSRDGKYLIFNSNGKLYTISSAGGEPKIFDTGFAVNCNNDHGFSPDGKMVVISDSSAGKGSQIYVLPAGGGKPRLVTEFAPSYWHGWSPDGKTLAYCAERNGNYDVYTISVNGGAETRLTDAEGLDDGPDYSPDGKYIYFNSERTGLMKIWRMNADGTEQTQMTFGDEYNDWFPHPSPDGKWLVFLSYDKSVKGHPPNKDVALRIMPAAGGEPRVLAGLFGGQGTINVPSWSPDSKHVAFVSYRLVGH